MDIAELGMKIDSRPAAQSKTDLAALVKVAHEAERAFNGMAGAANKAAAAQTKMNTVNVQGVSAIGQLGKVGPSALDAINKRESAERKLISSMQDQIAVQAMLNTGHAREAAIFKAMRSAGAQANTQYGETVANLAGTLHDLQRKTEGTERSSRSLANTNTHKR